MEGLFPGTQAGRNKDDADQIELMKTWKSKTRQQSGIKIRTRLVQAIDQTWRAREASAEVEMVGERMNGAGC